MKIRFYALIGLMFIAAGLLMGYQPFMNYWHEKHQHFVSTQNFATAVAASAPKTPTPTPTPVARIEGNPVKIEVPSANINLSVIKGYYNPKTQTWTLTNNKAQYAVMTPWANNTEGNTFIYGHDIPQVFARLNRIKPGDKVILTTDNNHRFTYSFRSAYETTPRDDSLFHYTGAPILTLQTCSGLWSQNRKLFTFDLVEAV